MSVTYFKRYRMEIDLTGSLFTCPGLPDTYSLVPWRRELLEQHAEVKFQSFCYEIDANVFPCLGERDGCSRLMHEITRRDNFVEMATWLMVSRSKDGQLEYCGTIQGLKDRSGMGAVQNLGIVPGHRGKGLGTVLLYMAMSGFKRQGMDRAFLEVTAQNVGAMRLYDRLGFQRVKTVYKAAEVAYA